jgi:hypothetical protein
MKQIRYFILGLFSALSLGVIAATVSYFGAGSADNLGVAITGTPSVSLSAHNSSLGALETSNGGTTARITTATSTQVYVGAAMLKRITVAASTAGTIAVYDDADGTCNAAGVLQKTGAFPLVASGVYEMGIEVSAGLCLLSTGVLDATVVFFP